MFQVRVPMWAAAVVVVSCLLLVASCRVESHRAKARADELAREVDVMSRTVQMYRARDGELPPANPVFTLAPQPQ